MSQNTFIKNNENSKSKELAHAKCKGVFTQGYHLSANSRRMIDAAATNRQRWRYAATTGAEPSDRIFDRTWIDSKGVR